MPWPSDRDSRDGGGFRAVFRTGDHRPGTSGTELDRIILYVPARILDLAEALAEKAGVASIQDYCALLLMRAIEDERVRQKIAGFESRRGPLEGLKEIADDPDYLAEWHKRSDEKAEPPAVALPADAPIFIEAPPAVEVYYPEPEPATPGVPAPAVDSLPAVAACPSASASRSASCRTQTLFHPRP